MYPTETLFQINQPNIQLQHKRNNLIFSCRINEWSGGTMASLEKILAILKFFRDIPSQLKKKLYRKSRKN